MRGILIYCVPRIIYGRTRDFCIIVIDHFLQIPFCDRVNTWTKSFVSELLLSIWLSSLIQSTIKQSRSLASAICLSKVVSRRSQHPPQKAPRGKAQSWSNLGIAVETSLQQHFDHSWESALWLWSLPSLQSLEGEGSWRRRRSCWSTWWTKPRRGRCAGREALVPWTAL